MVDGFAEVWPVVALEGVGDLIGDARPGFVAVDGGRRLAFANAAARALLPETAWGGPLAVDDRLAERLARFAARAVPGEETRELLRFAEAGRPILRTVVFRRPIDADDAVIVHVEGTRLPPEVASVEASLAPFAASGGLAALFGADGDVQGAAGDHALVEGLEEAIEKILAEADEIAVIERGVLVDDRRHDLALVRLGDRPDARRLLWLAPLAARPAAPNEAPEPAATTPAAIAATAPTTESPAESAAPKPAPTVAATIPARLAEVAADVAAPTPTVEPAPDLPAPDLVAPDLMAPAFVDVEETDAGVAATPVEAATAEPAPETSEAAEAPADVDPDTSSTGDDLFAAAPPLSLDFISDTDQDDGLADAWIATVAPPAIEPVDPTPASPEAVSAAVSIEPPALELSTVDPTAETPTIAPVALEPAPPATTASEPVPAVTIPAAAILAVVAGPIATAAHDTASTETAHDMAPPSPPAPLVVDATDDDAFETTATDHRSWAEPLPLAADETPLPLAARPPAAVEAIDAAERDATPSPLAAESTPSPLVPQVAPSDAEPAPAPAAAATSDFRFVAPDRAVKFVWQMDADHRFTMVSPELAAVVGPAAGDLVGRTWSEVAADLDLDRDGTIAGALARRDTWSGRTLLWPIEGEALRIPVDLAALPAFARGRSFSGFRGFGTCRAETPVPDPSGVGLRLAARGRAVEAPVVAAPEAPPAPIEEPVVACVVEPLAEPPLYPGDGESAIYDADHPIEPAFAGDIGDDVILHPETQVRDTLVDALPATAADVPEAVTATPADLHPAAPAPLEAADETPPAELLEPAITGETIALEADTSAIPPAPAPVAAPAIAPVLPRDAAPPSARVVALSGAARVPTDAEHLSVPERQAFRQIAEALGARIEGDDAAGFPVRSRTMSATALTPPSMPRPTAPALDARLLDRLPLAVALLRDDTLVHANDRFLSLLRYPDLETLQAEGGIDALFAGPHVARRFDGEAGRGMPVIARDGTVLPCEARLTSVPVEGGSAAMLTLIERVTTATAPSPAATPAAELVATGTADADRERIAELQAIVDTATDGVLILDANGLVLSANTAAEALFGVERRAMVGRPLTERLAPESRRSAMDYLDGLAANGVASVLNDGREVIGAVAPEGLIPLFMTIGRVSSGPIAKYCAVLRDITQWKKSEEDLTSARRRAEEASIHKSDFLAKISHEIRTPLNAIIGFSELMLDERFGPVGNDRYKDYLRDIHVSGSHIMSLVNDLLDLSKVEAGKMDLRFEAVPLADVVSECVAMMQPQANRERIIIRSSLPAGVPPVVADPRSMRQVVLNLLSNAIKFTPAGGQVIVSITAEDNGEVILRVRDTGYGMSDKELQTALEPFRQLHTTRSRSGGTGLGLPLTKALTEANRAVFRIDSTVGQGTLVSIAFPVTRVLAG